MASGGGAAPAPDDFTAALALHQSGDVDAAVTIYERLLALQPRNASLLHYLGVGCYQRGKLDEAMRRILAALEIDEREPMAHNNLGLVYQQLGRLDDALPCFDRAIEQDAANALAWNNRGLIHHDQKRFTEAVTDFGEAIRLRPDFFEAHFNRSKTLLAQQRFAEALSACESAISLQPQVAAAHALCGSVLRSLKRPAEALQCWDRALALNPDFVEVYCNQSAALHDLRRYEDELLSLDRAMALKPDTPYLRGDWLHARMQCGNWDDFAAIRNRIERDVDQGLRVIDPFALMTIDSNAARLQRCAATFSQDRSPASTARLWQGTRYGHDRIRVAYVSADYRDHPTSHLFAGVLERHDRARFEVTGIYIGPPTADVWHARMRSACEQFHEASTLGDLEIAQLIRSLEIDVLVDLMGHTAHARTGVYAYRPAPVQVHYLAFPGTMAAPYIDYVVADPVLIPPAQRPFYSEKIAYLPHSYQPNDATKVIAGTTPERARLGLPHDAFVFCSFNGTFKITPDDFDVWMRVLTAVPRSVLWLMAGPPRVESALRSEASRRGVAAERLVFAPKLPLADHLARHRCADLFLDTRHYNAHTTASDALWAGLPLLTCAGESFASRVAASLLTAVGLPELITTRVDAYESLAITLATQPDRLRGIREQLARQRMTCPLFDTALYTRHLENAFTAMHQRHVAGLPADDICVTA